MLKLKDITKPPPLPSIEQIEYYLAKWYKLESYNYQEKALNKLFFELCPDNKSIENIKIKTVALNDFYSTNIYSIFEVAKHIESLNHIENKSSIDERLNIGDITLVDDIKKVKIKDKEKNFYSFASKYCSHHKPVYYPIYDKYVDAVLIYFRDKDKFYNFQNKDLKEYYNFKNILLKFIEFYKLNNYCLKQIDKYIWQLGKDYFN